MTSFERVIFEADCIEFFLKGLRRGACLWNVSFWATERRTTSSHASELQPSGNCSPPTLTKLAVVLQVDGFPARPLKLLAVRAKSTKK